MPEGVKVCGCAGTGKVRESWVIQVLAEGSCSLPANLRSGQRLVSDLGFVCGLSIQLNVVD